jgi:RNA polymerase subunit RPABC4/transcription elongation factor Spt4
MNPCQNCGKLNSPETNFCRFCGTKYVYQQTAPRNPYEHSSPRPYAWKTDEFQTQTEPRPTEQVQAPTQPFNPNLSNFKAAPLALQPQNQMAPGANYAIDPNYHCPRCGTSYLPIMDRRISTAGWIVFSCLLVFTVIFFWIGLLMKEDVAICPVCRSKVS